MTAILTVRLTTGNHAGRPLLCPVGVPAPDTTPPGFEVNGADFTLAGETETGQFAAAMIQLEAESLRTHVAV